MLEKPKIEEKKILHTLEHEFGLGVKVITFLPLGADQNTAVYRVVTQDEEVFFLKLRNGEFNKSSVSIPSYLSKLGIKQVIPPLTTRNGQLHAKLERNTVILYPFVEGQNGFQRNLSDMQWQEFGATMRKFHTANFPSAITRNIPKEDFSPRWRELIKMFLARFEKEVFSERIAHETAAFLRTKNMELLELVKKTEHFVRILQERNTDFVLCHGDIHAWNLLLADNGALFLVDWDTLIFAPKERDLMFIGGGLGGRLHTPQDEETLFYEGYGLTPVDPVALTYYRYERILEDIAVYCDQIFSSNKDGEDRNQALENVKSNFLPNGVLDIARHSDRSI